MSRNLPWLAELQPEMFAEIDPILAERARDRGRRLDGDRDRAGGDRGARPRHRAHAPAADRGPATSTRSRCRGTGASAAPSPGDSANDLGALACDPNVSIQEDKAFTCNVRAGRRDGETTAQLEGRARRQPRRPGARRAVGGHRAAHDRDRHPARRTPQRMGFFTDTTVCIGCKACEVACKQWNDLPSDGGTFRKGGSYDSHGQPVRQHVAPRALRRARRRRRRRAARTRSPTWSPTAAGERLADRRRGGRRGVRQLGLHVRRLQALHERGLPRRVPDGRADPHRVRDRGAAARRLQRLRLLRARRARSASSTARPRTAAPASARSATTGSRTGSSPRARRRARPTRSSSAPTTSSSRSPSGASPRCTRAASRAPTSTAPPTRPPTSSRAASARSSC